jgi:predicted ATP-grasp superfamily ATP-dependent carboligase
MASNLRIFVCEFITGGGLYNAPLPLSLVKEGGLMLEALLSDLLELPDIELITTRDPRLPILQLPVTIYVPQAAEDVWPLWQRCIAEADAVWPIAPESAGTLEKLCILAQSKKLLGCAPDAVRMAASKYATARHLAQHGIPVAPTLLPADFKPQDGCYVVKPDDGAGCEDTRLFDSCGELRNWLEQGRQTSHVIQPWLDGEAASLSMLCLAGKAQLLSCNRQWIEVVDDHIHYRGSLLNGMVKHWDAFDDIARQVAHALPGLAGYVGIDVIVNEDQVTVLEINPRLTTSYAGLHRAIGRNPAGMVLDLLYNGCMIEADKLQRNVVEIRLEPVSAVNERCV